LPAGSPGAVCADESAAPNPSNPVKTSGNTPFINHLHYKLAAINAEDLCFVPDAICHFAFAAISVHLLSYIESQIMRQSNLVRR
jgi:hypothetical protein